MNRVRNPWANDSADGRCAAATSRADDPGVPREPSATGDVNRLLDLHDGPRALPNILAWGESAIPALERVLRGPSQALHRVGAAAVPAVSTAVRQVHLAHGFEPPTYVEARARRGKLAWFAALWLLRRRDPCADKYGE